MKSYIILTGSIYDMGGAEMYTSNKCSYLKSVGWDVRVFYFNKGHKIIIDNLNEFVGNYIPELKRAYYYFNSKQRNRIIEQICDGLTEKDEIVVESQLMGLTYWGELISKHIGAKNILNCLEEKIQQLLPSEIDFIEYKVRRHEVLNGSSKSFQRYFGKFYKQEYDQYGNNMVPLCSNVVTENDVMTTDIPIADFNLLSIGRLNKPYIQNMLVGVKRFVDIYKQYRFNLLIIGGSPDGSVEIQIQEMFSNCTNVNVCLLGYLYPISAAFIRKADVSMASANSVLVTSEQGIPTISYDITDLQTIGIFGKTTNNRFNRQNEPAIPTEILLEEILIKKKYRKSEVVTSEAEQINNVFAPQLDFLSKSPNDHKAYDVMSIHTRNERCISNLKRIILTIIGKFL